MIDSVPNDVINLIVDFVMMYFQHQKYGLSSIYEILWIRLCLVSEIGKKKLTDIQFLLWKNNQTGKNIAILFQ